MNDTTASLDVIGVSTSHQANAAPDDDRQTLVVHHGSIASRGTKVSTVPSASLLRLAARDVVSTTEICRFAHCRHQHLYADVRGIRETRLNLAPYSATGRLPASVHGDLVHDALRHFHEGSGRSVPELVRSAINAHPALHAPIAPETVDQITEEVCQTLAHPCLVRLREARLWPAPRFHFRLTPWIAVTGEMDLLAQWPDGRIEIVDYKTDRMPCTANDVLWREERVGHHALQAAIYVMACEGVLGPVDRFEFIFTHHAMAAAAPIDAATLSNARRQVLEIAAVVASGDPTLYGEPHWERDKCEGCPWLRICRPAGQTASPERRQH